MLLQLLLELQDPVQHITVARNGSLLGTARQTLQQVPDRPILYCFVIRRSPSEQWAPVYLGQSLRGRRRLSGYVTRTGLIALDSEVTPKRLAMLETMVKGLEIGIQ